MHAEPALRFVNDRARCASVVSGDPRTADSQRGGSTGRSDCNLSARKRRARCGNEWSRSSSSVEWEFGARQSGLVARRCLPSARVRRPPLLASCSRPGPKPLALRRPRPDGERRRGSFLPGAEPVVPGRAGVVVVEVDGRASDERLARDAPYRLMIERGVIARGRPLGRASVPIRRGRRSQRAMTTRRRSGGHSPCSTSWERDPCRADRREAEGARRAQLPKSARATTRSN